VAVKIRCRVGCSADSYCSRTPLLSEGSIVPSGCYYPYSFIDVWGRRGIDHVVDLSCTSLLGLRVYAEVSREKRQWKK